MRASLQELFPSLDKAVVADVLRHCADNVNEAADVLLGMSLETTTLVRQCHAAVSLQRCRSPLYVHQSQASAIMPAMHRISVLTLCTRLENPSRTRERHSQSESSKLPAQSQRQHERSSLAGVRSLQRRLSQGGLCRSMHGPHSSLQTSQISAASLRLEAAPLDPPSRRGLPRQGLLEALGSLQERCMHGGRIRGAQLIA